jgi:hypothetical protein
MHIKKMVNKRGKPSDPHQYGPYIQSNSNEAWTIIALELAFPNTKLILFHLTMQRHRGLDSKTRPSMKGKS